MKRISIGVAGVVLGALAALQLPSHAQPSSTPAARTVAGRTVTVTGTGTITSQPDEAVVYLGVQSSASSADAALTGNAVKMTRVLGALGRFGISKKDIATSDLSLYPRTDSAGTPRGYQASESVAVTVRDITKVGRAVDTAVGAGANLAGGISFQLSDQNHGVNDALAAAVSDSKSKAQVLASAGGAQLGGVVSIDATSPSPPPVYPIYAGAYGSAEARPAVPTPVNPPTLKTQVTVTVVWALA